MYERIIRKSIWVFAATAVIAGMVMSIQSARRINAVSRRLERKLRELNELHTMEREADRYAATMQAFEQLTNKCPAPLERIMKDTLSGYKMEEMRETRREAAGGWIVHQKEIAFREVPIGSLMKFLCRAEASRPPWRLSKCVIKSIRSPGAGKVVVVMEGLEKAEVRGPAVGGINQKLAPPQAGSEVR